jgi:enamine deaminase RidA (YjgF/YER057c/UK114 family)
MRKRQLIVPPGLEVLVEKYRYAPGLLVGDTLYVSGQVGRQLGHDGQLRVIEDKTAQFDQAFANVGKVLAAAGMGFGDVVELETWLLEFPGDLPLLMQVKDKYLGECIPTWTGFGVASFSMPGIALEVKVTAVRGA